jgi:hypothetical protein
MNLSKFSKLAIVETARAFLAGNKIEDIKNNKELKKRQSTIAL